MSCVGCSKKSKCTEICSFIEGKLYNTTSKECVHSKPYCYRDLGGICSANNPDGMYGTYVGTPGECDEQRCKAFLGCELGHEHWRNVCVGEGCAAYALRPVTNTFKFGIEIGFKKEVAYEHDMLDVVKHKMLACFGLTVEDAEEHVMPVEEVITAVDMDGLQCSKCKNQKTCPALKLCKEMYGALANVISTGMEEQIGDDMQVKLLTGSKFVSPEIRLKLVKLLKCEKFLAKRQRDCLWLYFIENMHQKDIADMLSAYKCSAPGCTFFSPTKVPRCARCGGVNFSKSNITSQAVNRHIKWGLSNIRKKFLVDLELFHDPEYSKICGVCGRKFTTKHAHQQYCLTGCRIKLYAERRREVRRERRRAYKLKKKEEARAKKAQIQEITPKLVCANVDCMVEFIPAPYQRYCSKVCRLKTSRTKYSIKIPGVEVYRHVITRR